MAQNVKRLDSKKPAYPVELEGGHVDLTDDGANLIVVLYLDNVRGPTGSGKAISIASTLGSVRLPGGRRLAVNLTREAVGDAERQQCLDATAKAAADKAAGKAA